MTESLRTDPAAMKTVSDPRDAEVRTMLHNVLSSLVDDEKSLQLMCISDATGMAFQVRSAPHEIGKLIGKSGRTARAIRTILSASAMKNGRRYTLDIAQ